MKKNTEEALRCFLDPIKALLIDILSILVKFAQENKR